MKKAIAFFLAGSMLVCLVGCNQNPNASSSAEVEVEIEEIVIDGTSSSEDTVTQLQPDQTVSNDSSIINSNEQIPSNTSSVTTSKPAIKIDYDTVVEVDICDEIVRSYLDATQVDNQFFWLNIYSGMSYDHQTLTLNWYRDGSVSYKVYFSESKDFSNSIIIETVYADLENTTLIPGKTYYWKVIGTITSDVLGGGVIKVKDAPVRWIDVDGVGNVRDMGGWKAEGGKTVKYGMLYRGRRLEDVTEEGIATIKQLRLKTEFDLRYNDQKFQTQGTGMNYEFIEMPGQYDSVLENNSVIKASYRKIFTLLSDESNYPIYSHCNAGADRTGTFAFIVSGVLGVSYEDLTRDFELTSFSPTGKRWRGKGLGNTFGDGDDVMQEDSSNTVAWGRLYKTMMTYGERNGCKTLQSAINHWLVNYVGVPQSQIDSFKNIMLK